MSSLSISQLEPIFTKMVNLVDEGIIIVDAQKDDLPIIYSNSGFSNITGYSAEEAAGKNPRFLTGPETNPKVSDYIKDCIKNKKIASANILNYKKDGTKFWNHFSITPIFDNLENVTHWIGIQRDITPIMDVIQDKSKEQSMYVTIHTINHIINNFLNSLVLFKDAMENCFGIDNKLLEEFNNEYNNLIQKLKLMSRIEKYKEKNIGGNFPILDIE
ncbi:MAG: PAS domain-containing protein [Ignavibacteriaceae bacterium]